MKYCIFNWVPNFHNFKDDGYLACNNFIILSHLCRITLTAPVQYMYTYHKNIELTEMGGVLINTWSLLQSDLHYNILIWSTMFTIIIAEQWKIKDFLICKTKNRLTLVWHKSKFKNFFDLSYQILHIWEVQLSLNFPITSHIFSWK